MARFADALEAHPAPSRLGDVSLRYEPSMLIGETARSRPSWRPSAAWVAGIATLLVSVAFNLSLSTVALWGLLTLAALLIAGGVWLERLEKRRRRFVANFSTTSLRLDFASPIAGYPQTLVLPFDDVREVTLAEQADGRQCLLVDFLLGQRLLREVLVAHITDQQGEQAERLARVLRGAFGLGSPTASEAVVSLHDESSFEP